jgi:hypothetical protein
VAEAAEVAVAGCATAPAKITTTAASKAAAMRRPGGLRWLIRRMATPV